MISIPFSLFVERLRAGLQGPLPGPAVQLSMAPSSRPKVSVEEALRHSCREAAVLALVFPLDGVPSVLLIVRPDHLLHHPGQISFPGGRREGDEALMDTALRETMEEVGVPPAAIDVLGPLTPLYIPPSNHCVYPFVGVTAALPPLRPQDAEVAAVLRVPLPLLLDHRTRATERWRVGETPVDVPLYRLSEGVIWGATAMILAELLALVDGV